MFCNLFSSCAFVCVIGSFSCEIRINFSPPLLHFCRPLRRCSMPIADYIRRMYRQYPEAPLQNTDPYRALTPWFENLPVRYLLPRSRPVPVKMTYHPALQEEIPLWQKTSCFCDIRILISFSGKSPTRSSFSFL